jgi:hypothetical protein
MTVRIGGATAITQFAGIVSPGEYQFNVVVPNVSNGDNAISIQFSGSSTQPNVFLTDSTVIHFLCDVTVTPSVLELCSLRLQRPAERRDLPGFALGSDTRDWDSWRHWRSTIDDASRHPPLDT